MSNSDATDGNPEFQALNIFASKLFRLVNCANSLGENVRRMSTDVVVEITPNASQLRPPLVV